MLTLCQNVLCFLDHLFPLIWKQTVWTQCSDPLKQMLVVSQLPLSTSCSTVNCIYNTFSLFCMIPFKLWEKIMNVGISQIWVLSVGMFKVVVCTFTTVNVCSFLSPTLSSQPLCAEEELCCQTPTWTAHWKRLKATHFNWLDGIHVNIIYESQSLTHKLGLVEKLFGFWLESQLQWWEDSACRRRRVHCPPPQ